MHYLAINNMDQGSDQDEEPGFGLRPVQLQPFPYQVSGCSIVLLHDSNTICKPLSSREYEFYQRMPDDLKRFTPQYRGVTEVIVQKSGDGSAHIYALTNNVYHTVEKLAQKSDKVKEAFQNLLATVIQEQKVGCGLQRENGKVNNNTNGGASEKAPGAPFNPWTDDVLSRVVKRLAKSNYATHTFIVLENVTAQFKRPSILDLKMGIRQHHDTASQCKVRLAQDRIASTTSILIGSRLSGMQLYHADEDTYSFINKYKGRSLSQEDYINTLRKFFKSCKPWYKEIVERCIARLLDVIDCIQGIENYRFYSSSMLIIYEASPQEVKVDVRMIDFANVTAASSDLDSHRYDEGIIFGLRNLVSLFREFCEEFEMENTTQA